MLDRVHVVLAAVLAACAGSPSPVDGSLPDGGQVNEPVAPAILAGPTAAATARSVVVRWTTDRPALGSVAALGPTEAATDHDKPVIEHRLRLFNLRPGSSYTARVYAADPADPSRGTQATAAFTTEAASEPIRVLFDAAHGQTAGNANWVIDDDPGAPAPAEPTSESSWAGSYSAFGFDLHRTGRFVVESFSSGQITFQAQGAQDLSKYDVLVLPEPNSWDFPTDPYQCGGECLAILAFVQAGGGLLAIADHPNSDRNGDNLDSPKILNRIFAQGGIGLSVDQPKGSMTTGGNPPCSSETDPDPLAPLVRGPFGDVRCVAFYGAGVLLAAPVQNPSARHVLWYTGASGNTFGMVGVAQYGAGRVVLSGDSSSLSDGTPLIDPGFEVPWGHPDRGNARLYLNAVSWLAGEY